MTDILPSWSGLTTFFTASFILAVTPGPGVFYIVTRSLAQGKQAGLASVVGVALGNLGNAIGASVGLAALFAVSSVAFVIVKYAGALYLIYLGIQALRTPPSEFKAETPRLISSGRIFRDGFLVALLNPKTAIFFAAFLPQFMGDATTAPVLQSIALGSLFVAIAATTDTIYALAAGSIAPFLSQAQGLQNFGRYLTSGAFIGLGLVTAFAGSRSSK